MMTSPFDMIEDQTEADAMREHQRRIDLADARSEHQWRTALADAIRRPMGVIPDSAIGLVNVTDLAKAEWRRMNRGKDDGNKVEPY
jgi:hypothetical protein